MHNINELIGIIKGINFDGIINRREVVRLQSWVDKNRNLAYEARCVELIRFVDKVLKDSIITNDERELMLLHSEKFLKETVDDTAKIYELNGIIEGIICDGEINKQEIYRLNAWINVYGEDIRGHKPSEALCKIVDVILMDGIVTESEQEQLLQMLSARISGSQFETKLEYLRKLVKARKYIGIELIDILDNEGAIEEIHKLAASQLRKTLDSYTGSYVSDVEVVFISLVLIAMLKYDGNYYENVEKIYSNLYLCYPEQKIEGLIRTILNRYRTGEETRTSRTRIINVVLSNAIVPSHFLPAFFEFIYDIYKLNFEYALEDNLYDEFQFVYEGLRTNMISEGDDVKLNVTKKIYKLIRSTKQLIANGNYIDTVIKLSIIVVKLIDIRIWNKELKIFNPYLKTGYEGWIETLKYDTPDSNYCRSRSEIRSRWEPKYVLKDNKVYIFPPVHKVKSEYNYWDIWVVVINGGDEIYINNEPDIREIIGGYQVSIDQIEIDNPLGMVTYKLMAGKEVIYDSREKLHRKFIVFETNGNEIKNNSDYSGTAVFCYINEHKQLKLFYSSATYNLASLNIKLGATYMIEDTVFNFSSLIKPGVFGDEYENHYLIDWVSDAKIRVYKQVKFIVFETDKISASYEIVINGNAHRLIDCKYTITERESVNKYVVYLELEQPGVHSIVVYQLTNGKRMKIMSFNLALDPSLEVNTLKINDERYMVTVKTDLCSTTINTEISVSEFSEDWIEVEYNGKIFRYCIPFNFDIYRISGSSWMLLNQILWIGDITQESLLDIYGTDVNEMKVYASTGESLDEVLKLKNKGVFQQVSIGFLMSYKISYDYVMLIFMQDGVRKKSIFCYNRCILDDSETELVFDPVTKILDVTPYYYGKGKVFLTICDSCGGQVYKSEILENEITISVHGLTSFEKYNICIYEKEKGLSLKKERLMKQYFKVFYAWDDFITRTFKINKVYYDQVVRGEFIRKSHYFNKSYLTFISKEDDDLYIGELYTKTLKGNYLLTAINPVSIEICSDVIENIIELSITKDGDGLFLDFEHHGIKNTLNDDSATDIFLYTIEMNGVETVE
ncbi:MAG: hypothetical protein K0R15_1627 [Clostridiales bacterium]|nr:hypothetical protein [Clostridiales bacterium]